jgi:hypothetical protein
MGAKIIKKFGFKKWYIFAISTMLIRMLIYATTSNMVLFSLASAVHGVGILTHISGNIAFLRKVVDAKVLGIAFSILASILAVSRALLVFVYGWLYEQFDGFAVFRMSAILLFLGLLWVLKSDVLKAIGDEIVKEL